MSREQLVLVVGYEVHTHGTCRRPFVGVVKPAHAWLDEEQNWGLLMGKHGAMKEMTMSEKANGKKVVEFLFPVPFF
jgi:hypothetical protein